jgi:hypothetical protein
MNVVSLHLLDLDVVHRFVGHLAVPVGASPLRDDLEWARKGNEAAANRLTYGLALALGEAGPVYTHRDLGLSFWEAQVDRSLGMLMRPPSKLFVDAGIDTATARSMPIRLDPQMGMMGGAYIPARLVAKAIEQFEEHLERSVKRLVEAETDPVPAVGMMHEVLTEARRRGTGVFEAQDVIGPDGEGRPGMQVVTADRARFDRDLVARVHPYATPPKKPGLLQRLLGRVETSGRNGQHHP